MRHRVLFDLVIGIPATTISQAECDNHIERYNALFRRYSDPANTPELAMAYSRKAALLIAKRNFAEAHTSATIAVHLDPYLACGECIDLGEQQR